MPGGELPRRTPGASRPAAARQGYGGARPDAPPYAVGAAPQAPGGAPRAVGAAPDAVDGAPQDAGGAPGGIGGGMAYPEVRVARMPAEPGKERPRRRNPVLGHLVFLIVLAAGAGIRAAAVLGYQPALWFWADSFAYVNAGLDPRPMESRPSGYALFLWLMRPFGSFPAVMVAQHLMGLATGVLIYAVIRRRTRLRGWMAALAAAPVLLDAHQVQIEHMVLAESLFTLLVTAAVTLALWRDRPAVWQAGAAGLLLIAASLTRTIGLAVLIVILVMMLIRRVGWRALTAAVMASVVPLAAYAFWFRTAYGDFGLTKSNVFLWSRTMTFADCDRLRPPEDEARLCPTEDLGRRQAAPEYIWSPTSPIRIEGNVPKGTDKNELAGRFARRAILGQPLDFVKAGLEDFARTFKWTPDPYPDPGILDVYRFPRSGTPLPQVAASRGRTAQEIVTEYSGESGELEVNYPYAGWVRDYQDVVLLRGPMIAVILLLGLGGVLVRWRRLGGDVLLPWAAGMTLLMVPPFIAAFDHRYVLPAVPLLCLAAALAFGAGRGSRPGRRRRGSGHGHGYGSGPGGLGTPEIPEGPGLPGGGDDGRAGPGPAPGLRGTVSGG
ncbi:hypothetical protein D5H75_12640 [Bailinhaonella thermotolerans]|uniref:Glycosyltransferase RgtA/B/C/D-like domain-containing protein n=1 Tax=Bailinhaonella thermotolerans TaxID=1070861 RepID=A0A3A4B2V4_9ACTN|nr:hypothetical protein D5H75_12640 [Bailinhaonella thermotolerans]